MKSKLKIFVMLFVMFFISGSYKNTGVIEINENRSVDIELIYALDQQKLSEIANDLDNKKDDKKQNTIAATEMFNADEIRSVYEKAGFKVTEYAEIIDGVHNWEGLKVTKHYNSIDDITRDELVYFLLNKKSGAFEPIDDNKIFSKKDDAYAANILVYLDFNQEPGSIDYSRYNDSLDLKYTIKLPEKVISTNAQEVSKDGKTLTWNLEMGNKNELAFEFDVPKMSFLMAYKNYIIVGSSALLILAISAIVYINRSKKENKNKK